MIGLKTQGDFVFHSHVRRTQTASCFILAAMQVTNSICWRQDSVVHAPASIFTRKHSAMVVYGKEADGVVGLKVITLPNMS